MPPAHALICTPSSKIDLGLASRPNYYLPSYNYPLTNYYLALMYYLSCKKKMI